MPARPVDFSKLLDPPEGVRNDSRHPPGEVMARLRADGIEITYGAVTLIALRWAMDEARDAAREIPADERHDVMASVDRALRASVRKVAKGVASKKRMDAFYADLLIWTALTELAA
jgi:hypothetical protein